MVWISTCGCCRTTYRQALLITLGTNQPFRFLMWLLPSAIAANNIHCVLSQPGWLPPPPRWENTIGPREGFHHQHGLCWWGKSERILLQLWPALGMCCMPSSVQVLTISYGQYLHKIFMEIQDRASIIVYFFVHRTTWSQTTPVCPQRTQEKQNTDEFIPLLSLLVSMFTDRTRQSIIAQLPQIAAPSSSSPITVVYHNTGGGYQAGFRYLKGMFAN